MIYPTDSRSELNEYPTHITCRTEMIHNRLDFGQVLDCALYSCIKIAQVTFVSLHLDLSRKY